HDGDASGGIVRRPERQPEGEVEVVADVARLERWTAVDCCDTGGALGHGGAPLSVRVGRVLTAARHRAVTAAPTLLRAHDPAARGRERRCRRTAALRLLALAPTTHRGLPSRRSLARGGRPPPTVRARSAAPLADGARRRGRPAQPSRC